MPSYRIERDAELDEVRGSFSRLLPNPPRSHTQLQQVATRWLTGG